MLFFSCDHRSDPSERQGQLRRTAAPPQGGGANQRWGGTVRHVFPLQWSFDGKLDARQQLAPSHLLAFFGARWGCPNVTPAAQQVANPANGMRARAQTISRINPSPTTIPKTGLD